MHITRLSILLLLSIAASAAGDPCEGKPTVETWIQCKLLNMDPSAATDRTQNIATKQTSSPAIASSSTSLVDHTSLADFATAALNVAGYGGASSQSPSVTTTVSTYAIYGALTGQNPLDPELYDRTAGWRQITFTIGAENTAATSSGSSGSSQGIASNPAKLVGATYLILNHRDLATAKNKKHRIEFAQSELAAETIAVNKCIQKVSALFERNKILYTDVREHKSSVDPNVLQELDLTLAKCRQEDSLSSEIDKFVAGIQNAAQLSISGQALIGTGATASDDYRAQVAFEKGLVGNFNWTSNASFDYINSPKIGGDTRGARIATDLQYLFKRGASLGPSRKSPVSLELSGEGDWFQSYDPAYVGQLKLTLPIAAGVDFPASVSYASKTSLLHEQHLVGKFGLTFDLSKIGSALLRK